jgi:hypothetical protein
MNGRYNPAHNMAAAVGRWRGSVWGALLLLLPVLSACALVHVDCFGTGCGSERVAVSPQDISVTGAANAHFVTGRGECLTYAGGGGYNHVYEKWAGFRLQLWLPGDRPRYLVEMLIEGYRGPGSFSTSDDERDAYDPHSGPIVSFNVYPVPSMSFDRVGTPMEVTANIGSDRHSGSLSVRLPDRTIAGTWRCVVDKVSTAERPSNSPRVD